MARTRPCAVPMPDTPAHLHLQDEETEARICPEPRWDGSLIESHKASFKPIFEQGLVVSHYTVLLPTSTVSSLLPNCRTDHLPGHWDIKEAEPENERFLQLITGLFVEQGELCTHCSSPKDRWKCLSQETSNNRISMQVLLNKHLAKSVASSTNSHSWSDQTHCASLW